MQKKLQSTLQKYKGSKDTTMKNYMPIKRTTEEKNGQILRKVQSPKTEPGKNRKYEKTNYQ